jgi:hypothetical protein
MVSRSTNDVAKTFTFETAARLPRARRTRKVAFWLLTMIVVWETIAGSLWDLLRIEYVRVVFAHLGYPLYLLTILGVWKLPGALVILAPGLPRLKEWAYAGVFFDYSGAAASHFLVHDPAARWVGPLVFAGITLASRALRPPELRQSASVGARSTGRRWEWTILAVIGLAVLSLLTLPKGAPPR